MKQSQLRNISVCHYLTGKRRKNNRIPVIQCCIDRNICRPGKIKSKQRVKIDFCRMSLAICSIIPCNFIQIKKIITASSFPQYSMFPFVFVFFRYNLCPHRLLFALASMQSVCAPIAGIMTSIIIDRSSEHGFLFHHRKSPLPCVLPVLPADL